MEHGIARARLLLSLVALASVVVDPVAPVLTEWVREFGGAVSLAVAAPAVIAHLLYSLVIIAMIARDWVARSRIVTLTPWIDISFAAAIGLSTGAARSPLLDLFFGFGVVAVAFRAGLQRTIAVAVVSFGYYMVFIALLPADGFIFAMRGIYILIVGYLVGYLAQQRAYLEEEVRALEFAKQRNEIARELHDGCVQGLAAVNLRLESCRELLRRGRTEDVRGELADMQASVAGEYDQLRTLMRTLAALKPREGRGAEAGSKTHFSVRARFEGSGALAEQVLQILREGVANVRRHAQAGSASLSVQPEGDRLRITIDDDGVGFRGDVQVPWSISSRARELGGTLQVARAVPGAHLVISLPRV
jgi:signal transduction histidine kinase